MKLIETRISDDHIYNRFQLEGIEKLHAGRKLEKDIKIYIQEHSEFDAGNNWYILLDEEDNIHKIIVVGRYE